MTIGGWLIEDTFYCSLEVIPKLYTFTRINSQQRVDEREVHLFFLGWYEGEDTIKLWTLRVLGLQLQVAFNL